MKMLVSILSGLATVSLVAAALVLFVPAAHSADAVAGAQVGMTFKKSVTKELSLDYLLFLPKNYDAKADRKWQVIVFLHGLGERGNNMSELDRVKMHGPPMLVEKNPDFEFIVVSPQCPGDSWWEFEVDTLNAMLDHVLATVKNADSDRVYLTGLSMGGFGSYRWAIANPERFAAVAPICGGGVYQTIWALPPEKQAEIKDLPFWIFHGESDTAVSPELSGQMKQGLEACGLKEVKLTTYPGVGHDSWVRTYENPELFKWFLSHSRAKRAAKTP